MVLVRLLLLPVKILGAILVAFLKVGWWGAKAPVRVGVGATRRMGIKALFFLIVGVVIGVLFAPGPGSELRTKLRQRIEGGGLTDDELADKVGFELSHAPRTWHLPQPEVAVLNGAVELRGSVPHGTGRDELERVAAAVAGVSGVDNRLEVDESADSDSSD